MTILEGNGGHVANACKAVKIGRRTAYDWRDQDAEFANRWDDIVGASLDDLEQEAYRRAYHGVERPVFYQGAECGSIREYSDSVLMFILKAGRPEKYRDHYKIEHGGHIDVTQLSDEELRRIVNSSR